MYGKLAKTNVIIESIISNKLYFVYLGRSLPKLLLRSILGDNTSYINKMREARNKLKLTGRNIISIIIRKIVL